MDAFGSAAEEAADKMVDFAESSEFVDAEMQEIITTIDDNVPERNVMEHAFEATFEEANKRSIHPRFLLQEEIQNVIQDVNFDLTDAERAGLSVEQIELWNTANKPEIIQQIVTKEDVAPAYKAIQDFKETKHEFISDVLVDYNLGGAAVGGTIGAIMSDNSVNEGEHQG